MLNVDIEYVRVCIDYTKQLLKYLEEVYRILSENKNSELIKTYVSEFGQQLEELVKVLKSNKIIRERVLEVEKDLLPALHSFSDSYSMYDYELSAEILKYEMKYILNKWVDILKEIEL